MTLFTTELWCGSHSVHSNPLLLPRAQICPQHCRVCLPSLCLSCCHLTAPHSCLRPLPLYYPFAFLSFQTSLKTTSSLMFLRCLCGLKTNYSNTIMKKHMLLGPPLPSNQWLSSPCCLPLFCLTHDNCSGGL